MLDKKEASQDKFKKFLAFKERFKKDFDEILDSYLVDKYKGTKSKSKQNQIEFAGFYYDENQFKKIQDERIQLTTKTFDLLSVIVYAAQEGQEPISIEKKLKEKQLPQPFIDHLFKKLKQLTHLKLLFSACDSIKHEEIIFKEGERRQSRFSNESISFLTEEIPPDFEEKCTDYLNTYGKLAKISPNHPNSGRPTLEQESLLEKNASPYWLSDFIHSSTVLISRQIDLLAARLDNFNAQLKQKKTRDEEAFKTIINFSHPHFVKLFVAHKQRIFILKNAIQAFHFRFDLNTIIEPALFDRMISDIRDCFLSFSETLKSYINNLIARATQKGRETIRDFLVEMIDEVLAFFTLDILNARSLFSILGQREEDLEDDYFEQDDIPQGALALLTRRNGDINYGLFVSTCQSMQNIFNELFNKRRSLLELSPIEAPAKKAKTIKPQAKVKNKNSKKRKQETAQTKSSTTEQETVRKTWSKDSIIPLNTRPLTAEDDFSEWESSKIKKLRNDAARKMRQGELDAAIASYNELIELLNDLGKKPDYIDRFNLASCYETTGKIDMAANYLDGFPKEWQSEYQYLFARGRIFLAQGNIHEAKAIFFELAKTRQDNEFILQSIARIYQRMNDYSLALSYWILLYKKNPSFTNTLHLIHGYAKTGKFAEALAILDKLEEQDRLPVLRARVHCYHAMKKFKLASDLLEDALKKDNNLLSKDKRFFLLYLYNLMKKEDFQKAFALLRTAPLAWLEDTRVVGIRVHCYLSRREYVDSIKVLEEYAQKRPNDLQILHLLSRSYLEAGKIHKAKEIAERMIAINPYNIKAQVQLIHTKDRKSKNKIIDSYSALKEKAEFQNSEYLYCSECLFLLKEESPEDSKLALERIYQAISKFPQQRKFYELLVEALIKCNLLKEAQDELRKALVQFPNSLHLHVEKIRLLRLSGQEKEARLLKDDCIQKFAGSPKVKRLFEEAFRRTKARAKTLSFTDFIPEEKSEPLKITLSPLLLQAFKQLKETGGDYYLTGSTAMKMVKAHLNGQAFDESEITDLDFSARENPKALEEIVGVHPHPYKKNIYTRKMELNERSFIVDLDLHPDNSAMEEWLLSNAEKRDFKNCALLIEEKDGYGIVHGLEGTIEAIRNGMLEACSYPQIKFENDPACVLRAVKYQVLYGLKPSREIVVALEKWNPITLNFHYGHLLAMLVDYFDQHPTTIIDYLSQLHNYGILKKIFQSESQIPYAVLQNFDPKNPLPEDFLVSLYEGLRCEILRVKSEGNFIILNHLNQGSEEATAGELPGLEDQGHWPSLYRSQNSQTFFQSPSIEEKEEPGFIQDYQG